MKILVVDDNDAIRAGLCELLERADPGYRCEGASDGDEALAKAKASKPEVVVLDMLMPGMSGLGVARLISDSLPATKILLHTVHGSDLLSANASRYGVFRVIDKTDGKNLLAPSVRSPRYRDKQQAKLWTEFCSRENLHDHSAILL
jgi:CheY-like chemotaxis protein